MAAVAEVRRAKRSEGSASILAIGTTNPVHWVDQSTYADYYFRVTNSEHKMELKEKFKLMCEKSMIRKRHMHLTEEFLKKSPNLSPYKAPSLSERQEIAAVEVPKLGKEAAEKAIAKWGQPKSKITHLVFSTTAGLDMPSADCRLTTLLGLRPSVRRFMMYHQGCFAGGAAIRMAKDLAENNVGARVLVVCSELVNIMSFRGPSAPNFDNMVTEALFGDGASAAVVGSGPFEGPERPLFHLISAMQYLIPDSDNAITGSLHGAGASFQISKDVPCLISKNIRKCLDAAFHPLGISDWHSLFWIAHPGGPAILDEIEAELGLEPEKLRSTRHVLSEYGNMLSASVLFVLDEMRKDSMEKRMRSTGEGLDWGVLFGFGPGLTIETVVLRSVCNLMPKSNI